jgi:hypothetical protein
VSNLLKFSTMVDKRSLRSSKKDGQDTPAEEEKPKPTRTRSARSRKGKNAEASSGTEESTTSANPPLAQSEDVVMETENEVPPENKPAEEDVEMKNAADEKKEETKEDPTASPLTSTIPFSFISLLMP